MSYVFLSRYSLKFLHLILGVSFLFVLASCQPVDETPQTFSITSISPTSGDVGGGYTITISGRKFSYIDSIEFDGVPCTDAEVFASEITCTVPPKTTPGPVSLVVVGKANRSASTTFTYNLGTPTVTSFAPLISPLAGGTSIFVYGTGFATGTTVTIGGTACAQVNVMNSTMIECVTPAMAAGTYAVVATNTNGMTGTAPATFTYNPPPSIATVSPAFGTTAGGATITVTGTGFLSGIRVLVGNTACGSVNVASPTSLTCVTSMSTSAGLVNVRVINPDSQTDTLMGAYTFNDPPVITSISPTAGTLLGGTTLTINGSNFSASTTFQIGGITCPTVLVNSTKMTCSTPARAAGSYAVSAFNPGTATNTQVPGYTYQAAPDATSITPTSGPLGGGTAVVISGTGFIAGATVTIGTVPCVVTSSNATSIACTTGANAMGPYAVTVTNPDTQTDSLPAAFTYQPAPDVTSISPVVAPVSGGTNVTITGTAFIAGATVTVGGSPCTFVSEAPPTQIVCTTTGPFTPSAGDIRVINPDGQSDTLTAGITFLSPPTISTVAPSAGALGGNTTITIVGTNFYSGLTVTVDGLTCSNVALTGTTNITCDTPSHPIAATVDVSVINPDLQSDTKVGSYTYQPAPTVTGIAAANGPATLSTTVTITGTNFLAGATVDIGGSACSGVMVLTPTSIQCSTGVHAAGAATVKVTNADAQFGTFTSYTYDAAPAVTTISPSSVPSTGPTTITLTGTNFVSAPTVDINGVPCTSVTFISSTQITCDAQAATAGSYDVVVTNPDMQTVTKTNGLTYLDPPTVSSVAPTAGALAGGTTITVTGTNFVSGSAITIGGTTCPTTFVSSTTLTCISPAKAAAAYVLDVTNPDGVVASGGYTYQAAPTVTSVAPASGPMTGGAAVVINGTGFVSPSAVTLGGSACTITASTGTTINCTTTAHAAAAVTVSVTNGDTQVGTLASGYTYDAGPDIANITPILGPTAGGTTLTLNGSTFVSGATVTVNGVACAPVTFVNSTQVTCPTPASGTAGAKTVVITNPDGQTDSYSSFTYLAPPALTSISPNGGPPAGSTSVTITGSGFQNGAGVTFGGAACTGVTVVNSTTITCTTPAGSSGAANVVVTNFDGQTGSSAALFSYNNPPLVSNVTPNIGKIGGGDSVTIAGSGFISGATATFGSSAPVACAFVSVNALTCTTPSSIISGGVSVKVTNPDNQSNTLNTGYVYLNPPSITSISPNLSRMAGGATATITGSGFFAGATVMINGSTCTSPTVTSNSITCVVPGSAVAGSYDVVVTNVDSQQATLVGGFTYQNAPTLTTVSPSNGHYNGGMTITLTGTNFVAGASVSIGGVNCGSVTVLSPTSITCITSPGSNGTYAVRVTNTDGQFNSVAQNYTYRSAPVVSNVANTVTPFPAHGRSSVAGTVNVNGSGFFAGDTVKIGTQDCTAPTVISQNQIRCTYPVQAAGVYSVTVTSPDRTGTLANAFRYRDDPTITSVSPNSGVQAGNTLVTITGTNFYSGAVVEFGAVSSGSSLNDCTSVTVVSPTTITCRTPALGAGALNVNVTQDLMPTATLAGGYTYTALAVLGFNVGSVSPTPPNPDSFGTTSTNVTHTYTVRNTGEGTSSVMTVSIGGTNPGAFFKGTDNCDGMTLPMGGSCTIQVTFIGGFLTTGSYTGTLQVTAATGGTTTNTMQGSVP